MERPEPVLAKPVRPALPGQRRRTPAAAAGAIVLLAAWAGGATLYVLFKDEALKHLVSRQVAITRSYETQAAALQAEIDRLRSLKLVEQERVDRTLADLARRQAAVETRQAALAVLKDRDTGGETTGSLPVSEQQRPAERPKPSPLSSAFPALRPAFDTRVAESTAEARIADLSLGLRQLEAEQSRALSELEIRYDGRARRIREALDELGVQPRRAAQAATGAAATGGPFLPWTRPADDPFARQLHRVRAASAAAKALEREIGALPVRRPAGSGSSVTSHFGMRLDPFLRQPALHTGIDFSGEPGDPVYAAADGRVVQAERNGGYGLMVEIDHGNGLATRYAHLSALAVREGAAVAAGDLVGQVGSTGRSTGPHLHYEIRLEGDAVDPRRFLRAGRRLQETP